MAGRVHKNTKTRIGLVVIAALVVGGAVWVKLHHTQPQTEQQKLQQEAKKAHLDPKKDSEAGQRAQATPPASPASGNRLAKPVITTLEEDRGIVILDATVGQTTTGTCEVSFSKGGSTISRTQPIVLVTSYYSCQELQLPGSTLSGGGNWQVSVVLNSNGQRSDAATSEIMVQ